MSLTFNGICSDDLHCTVEQFPSPVRGERRAEYIVIPGRNGAILREDRSFATYTQSYELHIDARGGKLYQYAREIAEWLLGTSGFCRLEDSYDPDVYRMAAFTGPLNLESVLRSNHGRAVIDFTCQPQCYLRLGEAKIRIQDYSYAADIYVYDLPPGTASVKVRASGSPELRMENPNDYRDRIVGTFTEEGEWLVSSLEPTDVYSVLHVQNLTIDTRTTILLTDKDGTETELLTFGDGVTWLMNPTRRDAMPLIEFRDVSTTPTTTPKTLTILADTYISSSGEVLKNAWADPVSTYTSEPVDLDGAAYAYISGNSYAFYNAQGTALQVVTDYHKAHRVFLNETKVIIPAGAATMIIGGTSESPSAALSLQTAVPDPGTGAVRINGTTVNLDFSDQDTIILDCDLHDARYLDGSNANGAVSFASSLEDYPTFPALGAGRSEIIPGDGLNLDLYITPRWWSL